MGSLNSAMRAFLITIDTEGDNLWARPRANTTENAKFLPRFQSLCERFGYKPTYLTNYEMAQSGVFRDFAHDVLRRGAGEVGMHLHAWDSPPIAPLTADDRANHPYLMEFPEAVMRQKVAVMTDLLEGTFGRKMISHRAGRWGFNSTYARVLVDYGYRVDCSVTPLISWRSCLGDPEQGGGPDYTSFPDRAYFVDLGNVAKPGNSPLLEVPLSVIGPRGRVVPTLHRCVRRGPRLVRGPVYRCFPPTRRLVPTGSNLRHLLQIVRRGVVEGRDYVEFTLHSSEFMPGGSPRFRTPAQIETLYEHLEQLFRTSARWFTGATLGEFYQYAAAASGRGHTAVAAAGHLPS